MRESPLQELVTIRDYLRWATSCFNRAGVYFGHGTDNAWDEAIQLVLPSLSLDIDSPPHLLDARLTLEERQQLISLIEKRVDERIPVAYLTGKAWFAGLEFIVDERVLIPRSPFAELIEQEFSPWLTTAPERILDLCCGSGCIGLAAAVWYPDSDVVVADISDDALAVAQSNIQFHQLEESVAIRQSDVFDGLKGEVFDLIIANPPYVDADDMASLPQEYLAEPRMALASGDDGLDVTRRILRDAHAHLSAEGILFVEVGNSWPALEAAFPEIPFTWVEFERGGHGVFAITAEELKHFADCL